MNAHLEQPDAVCFANGCNERATDQVFRGIPIVGEKLAAMPLCARHARMIKLSLETGAMATVPPEDTPEWLVPEDH